MLSEDIQGKAYVLCFVSDLEPLVKDLETLFHLGQVDKTKVWIGALLKHPSSVPRG